MGTLFFERQVAYEALDRLLEIARRPGERLC